MIVPSMTYEEIVKAFRKDIEASENKIDSFVSNFASLTLKRSRNAFPFAKTYEYVTSRRTYSSLRSYPPKEVIGRILNSASQERFTQMKAFTASIWVFCPRVIL